MGQVTVTINGRTYRLACGDGDEGRVAELAANVSQRIDRIVAEVGSASQDLLLLMVALLLADEVTEQGAGAAGRQDGAVVGEGDSPRPSGAGPSARAKRAAGRD